MRLLHVSERCERDRPVLTALSAVNGAPYFPCWITWLSNVPSFEAGMKQLTHDQLQGRKEKAVRFVREVLGDPERAEEIAEESLEDYAQRRKIQLLNPFMRRNAIMATTRSKAELEAEIADLKDENEELQDQLDAIADIVAPEDEDDDSTDGDDEDGEDDDQD